jgi:glyoxylase-like metal-dependent hydrolase (beta-lactamase superfamily II)
MYVKPIKLSSFRAPGQIMFGAAPAEKWQRLYPADEDGNCNWALRSLLIEHENKLVLIDTGFGNGNPELLKEYMVVDYTPANEILKKQGIDPSSITHIVHTHLHIDHCGGSFYKTLKGNFEASFPYSQYIVGTKQLETANNPTEFERDSFDNGIVNSFLNYPGLMKIGGEGFLFPWLEFLIFNGHTSGLLVPVIHWNKKSIAFCGDLIPTIAHLELNCASGYDMNQMMVLAERDEFLEEAFDNEYYLCFQHDALYECCSLKKENSRIVPAEYFNVEDVFSA